MESDIGHYYNINRKLLSIVGQWPYQNRKERLPRFLLIVLVITQVMFFQVAQYVVCEDMQCIYETLPPNMLAMMATLKLFTLYLNKQKMKELTDRLFGNWDMFKEQEELEIMKKYAETGRWYAVAYVYYFIMSIVIFVSFSFTPLLLDLVFPSNVSQPIMLVWKAYYFVDEKKYFYYIFCSMVLSLCYGINGIISHDCMLFVYLEHVSGLFAVIGFRFEHMLYKSNNEKMTTINHPDLYAKKIGFIVHAHREALQFVILLENAFSISFGIQMMFVTVGMSITLVQFSIQLQSNLLEAVRYLLFITGQLIHLFCYSFEGQKLINQSTETCDKIYNGPWYEIPTNAQKMLLIAMRKSVEASIFTAGKIYIFSLENFTTVLQSSMSYFTVLSSMNE